MFFSVPAFVHGIVRSAVVRSESRLQSRRDFYGQDTPPVEGLRVVGNSAMKIPAARPSPGVLQVEAVCNADVARCRSSFPLRVLPATTPILFQWEVLDAERFRNETYPILSTPGHPYLSNIVNACTMEPGRAVGLYLSGAITEDHKRALEDLKEAYTNFTVIYEGDVSFSGFYQKTVVSCIEDTIALYERNHWNQDLIQLARRHLEEMKPEDRHMTLLDEALTTSGHPRFDHVRNMLLMKGGAVLQEAGRLPLDGRIPIGEGLIYLDCDMVLTAPIGEIALPDGFGAYSKNGTIENGIAAVDRPHHPVLKAGMRRYEGDWHSCHPYDHVFCGGIREHFGTGGNLQGPDLARLIAFPVDSIDADTSSRVGSSWKLG